MSDTMTFEALLDDAFERYLADAPTEVDAAAVAGAVAGASLRRGLVFTAPRRLALAFLVALLALAVAAAALWLVGHQRPALVDSRPDGDAFIPVGSMPDARSAPVLVPLPDGRLLIAGGRVGDHPDLKLWDPSTNAFVTSNLNAPSGQGSGVLLADGRALILTFDSNAYAAYAYLVDTETLTTRPLNPFGADPPFGAEPPMAILDDGRVLASGGKDTWTDGILATAVLFDPAADSFVTTGSMHEARRFHAMTKLGDGRVLVAGGEGQDPNGTLDLGSYVGNRTFIGSLEIYDPRTGAFSTIAATLPEPGATLGTLLPDGRVLLAPRGGATDEYLLELAVPPRFADGAPIRLELFDPAAGTATAGPTLPGMASSITSLADGRVLVTGERSMGHLDDPSDGLVWVPWAATYDPADGTLAATAQPSNRLAPVARLRDGRVIFVGGLIDASGSNPSLSIFEFK